MDLHGSIEDNIIAAIRSARRLCGHPVYSETLNYWGELLHQARHDLAIGAAPEPATLEQLVLELESQLAERTIRA